MMTKDEAPGGWTAGERGQVEGEELVDRREEGRRRVRVAAVGDYMGSRKRGRR